jgi:hypothetical protein
MVRWNAGTEHVKTQRRASGFGCDTLRKKFALRRVDSPSPRSTSEWSRSAHPAPRNFPGPTRSKLLYK